MHYIIALLILACSLPTTAQPTYTKSTEFSALRVSYAALQSVLDKAGSLALTANGGSKPEREELELQAKELKLSLSGRQFVASPAKIPNQVDRLSYSYIAATGSPITQLELNFSGNRRDLTVRGSSADQVDALFATLSVDLTALSHPVGGGALQSFLGFPMIFFIILMGALNGWNWYWTRLRGYATVTLALIAALLLVVGLPLDQLLSGFLAVRGDPSPLVRYGAEISFLGLFLAVVGVPAAVLPFLGRRRTLDEQRAPLNLPKKVATLKNRRS